MVDDTSEMVGFFAGEVSGFSYPGIHRNGTF